MPDHRTDANALLYNGYILLFAVLPWSLVCAFESWTIQLPSEPLLALLGIGLIIQVLRRPESLYNAFKINRLFFLIGIDAL